MLTLVRQQDIGPVSTHVSEFFEAKQTPADPCVLDIHTHGDVKCHSTGWDTGPSTRTPITTLDMHLNSGTLVQPNTMV